LESYADEVYRKNEASTVLLQLTSEIEKDIVSERVIIGYQTFGNKVFQKILFEILKYSSVANTLRGAVTLPTTKVTSRQ
jgi:hypothetical protein